MKKDSEYSKFIGIGLCAVIFTYFFTVIPAQVSPLPSRISSSINDLSYWWVYKLSKRSIKPYKVIAIAVDDFSLSKVHQRWPWKRSVYAQLLKVLDKEKVNTIGMDFVFVGESEDKEDDRILQESLKEMSSKVVLSYFFDFKKASAVLPLSGLKDSVYSMGMLNTPIDADGKTRRLRGYIDSKGNSYYSFSVELASAFLNQKPNDLISRLPLSMDKTYPINYLWKPQDFIKLSFYDVLTNLDGLKKDYGKDFLNGSLVLVYPESEILHDMHDTPLGRMPGGILHLNGVADILLGKLIKEIKILLIPFLIFSFIAILYLLRYFGFMAGVLFTFGIIIFDFWCLVLLNLTGLRFDYSFIAIFAATYFICGSIYKYISFLAQILEIKNKATIDPLTNLFTLRYFYYRLGLEINKIYFLKKLFLVFVYIESLKEITEEMPLNTIKDNWRDISSAVSLKGNFWSLYSQDQLAGCLLSSKANINNEIILLKNRLQRVLNKNNIKTKLKIVSIEIKRSYPVKELLFSLSGELENQDEDIVSLKESDAVNLIHSSSEPSGANRFLDSLDEDIEEKNRQLLNLIENLNIEHAKTKEAFFQIITSLVNALEARDSYTEGHSERVSNYALTLAGKLGWPAEEKEKLRKASLLHDLGKIGIPDRILHKKGQLNDEEYDSIKKHEIIGVKILEPLKDMSEILPWILYHHERWDGQGYPHGLAGNAIPEAAQIISLADVFDALTTGRDYKKAYSWEEAIKEIVKNKGTQFNPQLVDLFIETILSTRLKKTNS